MQLKNINYAFVIYLALIEGISLFVLDLATEMSFSGFTGFLVGFMPALTVLLIYRITSEYLPIRINGRNISELPVLLPSIANGLFIIALFFVQTFIPNFTSMIGKALFGFSSVLIAALVLIVIYNVLNFKASFMLGDKLFKLNRISLLVSVYAGIFEFFILPLMFLFYSISMLGFFNGLFAGLIGGFIGLWIVNKILKKKPLTIDF